MKLREVAYFLKRLDDPAFNLFNGKSVLENSMITISTESGDGCPNDAKRELSGIFHAITGANGRFKASGIVDVNSEGVDVYNTMLGAMGCERKLGPENREARTVDKNLA